MMKKTALSMMAVLSVAFSLNAQTKPAPKPAAKKPVSQTKPTAPVLKTGLDSFSYAIGLNIAKSMKSQGITSINDAMMQKGITDVLKDKDPLLTDDEANMCMQTNLQQYANKKSAALKAEGEAFLAFNKTRNGVTTLPNGLQYEVLKAGDPNGKKPAAVDTVVVHYIGTLIDGTKFDASTDRGEPATFPLSGVIRGWTEILQLMTPGAKWKVYIPADLAWGDRGNGATIPPGAAVIFEIDLLDIKPAKPAEVK